MPRRVAASTAVIGSGASSGEMASSPRSSRGSARLRRTAACRVARSLANAAAPGVGLLGGDDPGLDQGRPIQLAHARMSGDGGVHQRLRVRRLVALVVPVAPIADQVDHDVAVEPLAVHAGQPGGGQAGLGIVRVDVDDRCVEALGQVARVVGGATLGRLGGEADLVVGDQVQRPAGGVAGQARHVEGLGHHALGGERGIAVDQDRDGAVRVDGCG